MKKIIFAFVMALMGAGSLYAQDRGAINFVSDLADKVINEVITSDKTPEEKLVLFQNDFQEALDLKSIGQFVLGVYWKKATSDQRAAFLKEFTEFTTKTWTDRFNMYDGEKFSFTGTRDAGRSQIYVDSSISSNPPVNVIWRLRQKDGTFRIIDIIVEGVSMAMSYRNEYTAFLQKNDGNIDRLINELQTKSKNFKFTEKK